MRWVLFTTTDLLDMLLLGHELGPLLQPEPGSGMSGVSRSGLHQCDRGAMETKTRKGWVIPPFQRQHVLISGHDDGLPPALVYILQRDHQIADFNAVPIFREAVNWRTPCRSWRWGNG